MNIHRYFEYVDDGVIFLHDVRYDIIDEGSQINVLNLATYIIGDGIVTATKLTPDTPLNNVTLYAAYMVLMNDGISDANGYLIKH